MIRLLIFLGVFYFGYRFVKSWLLRQISISGQSNQPRSKIDDEMVKDPYCEVYFPKREGIHLRIEDQDYYFCSTECRDKFLAVRSKR